MKTSSFLRRDTLCLLFSLFCGNLAHADKIPSFQKEIFPLVQSRCGACHGKVEAQNGLNLLERSGWIKGGKTGAALQPGSLRDSLVWSFLATDKMPAEGKKLTLEEKNLIRRWILAGSPLTEKEAQAATTRSTEQTIPLKTIGMPAMAKRIDELVMVRLKEAQTESVPQADDAEFVRRVFLDLNGRVPTYQETMNFLEDSSPDKRQKLIDQQLASEEFGRHQAIIWHKLLIPKSAGAYPRIPHQKFRDWLAGQFNWDEGWDRTVTELITAEGYLPSNKDNANTRKQDAKRQPQNVATAFIKCV